MKMSESALVNCSAYVGKITPDECSTLLRNIFSQKNYDILVYFFWQNKSDHLYGMITDENVLEFKMEYVGLRDFSQDYLCPRLQTVGLEITFHKTSETFTVKCDNFGANPFFPPKGVHFGSLQCLVDFIGLAELKINSLFVNNNIKYKLELELGIFTPSGHIYLTLEKIREKRLVALNRYAYAKSLKQLCLF